MSTLSRVAALVRQHDPDRFFTTLFAPAPARPALWALYAFNHELARAREAVREPMMAMIRLQWWREVVDGEAKRHEVATPLREALDAGALRAADLLAMIEGREAEPPEDADAWRSFVDGTAGAVAAAAGNALGVPDAPAVRAAGSSYGAAGVLRNVALAGRAAPEGLRQAGLDWLAQARRGPMPKRAVAAALPAVFAAADLRRAMPVRERGMGDKLRVALAGLRGSIS